jgi:MGT family glycosyltransferase
MIALADAIRSRGHRITFFLLGTPPSSVSAAGFEVVQLGGAIFPVDEYKAGIQKLGTLSGRAALSHTTALIARATEAILQVGPSLVREAKVTALVVDQSSFAGGTVADHLGLPFATVCNALLLNAEPKIPPFFSSRQPRNSWWSRLQNKIGWAGLNQLYAPITKQIQGYRRRHGLAVPAQIADTWSDRIQISQQPAAFEFPRQELPKQFRFVGPMRRPEGNAPVEFPWSQLDDRPLIYASLGTLQNRAAATFRTIAKACTGLDVQLVMSTGRGLAPKNLGELSGRPIIVAYAPQVELIHRSALVITHAGLNTVLDALSVGVPMVAIPITNEQPGIAARVAWTGAGEALSAKRVTPKRLRSLVIRVWKEPSYRAASEHIRQSIQAGGGAPLAAKIIAESLALGE